MRQDFHAWTRTRLEAFCRDRGHSLVHAKDLFRRAYKELRTDPWADGRFPRALTAEMDADFAAGGVRLAEEHRSGYDGSVKFLVALADGSEVETVLMPEKQRVTLCVSTQVGCAQGCVFCHTGRMGLKRNLSAGEIVGQIVAANRWTSAHPAWLAEVRLPPAQKVTNVVFMGMGEPLDNVEAVIDALAIMTDPYGLGLGAARISVSTAGHLDGIVRLLDAVPNVRLALSVHSPDDAKRSRIMPINRRWPLADVMAFLRERLGPDGAPVMLQYTLIRGVNDSVEEAERLAALTAGLNVKVNLIPLNEVGASRLTAPDAVAIQTFRDVLYRCGLRVMVRYSKGQDIAAACGQLVV